jgi:hypothetical protein
MGVPPVRFKSGRTSVATKAIIPDAEQTSSLYYRRDVPAMHAAIAGGGNEVLAPTARVGELDEFYHQVVGDEESSTVIKRSAKAPASQP